MRDLILSLLFFLNLFRFISRVLCVIKNTLFVIFSEFFFRFNLEFCACSLFFLFYFGIFEFFFVCFFFIVSFSFVFHFTHSILKHTAMSSPRYIFEFREDDPCTNHTVNLRIKNGTAVDPQSRHVPDAHVYRRDGHGLAYSAYLMEADVKTGKNAYYKLQVLESETDARFVYVPRMFEWCDRADQAR